ncbi:hypothetical protein GGS20DRAFT_581654 [Poronia punctata]|nr:hypothetical protein GGS20DRAFT_581654 [Poronia punctata]
MAVPGSTNIIIISVVFTSLAVIFVLLRFRARMRQKAPYLADDHLIAVAATVFASEVLGYPPLTCTKLSILFFYRRVFLGKRFALVTLTLLILSSVWGVAFFFATLFTCYPVSYAWTTNEGTPEFDAHCYNPVPMFYGSAVSNMIMDIFILIIPAPMVWRLVLPTRQKMAIIGIFLLGAFVVGITAIRVSVFVDTGSNDDRDYDITYNLGGVIYWSQLETAIAIICACLPTLHIILVDSRLTRLCRDVVSKISLLTSSSSRRSQQSEPSYSLRGKKSASSIPGGMETGGGIRLGSSNETPEIPPVPSQYRYTLK